MGLAMDLQEGFVANPSATITAVTPPAGDTFVVRSFSPGASAYLEQLFRSGTAAGIVRVRSPLLHDFVQGVRFACPAGSTTNLIEAGPQQHIMSQDALTVEVTGGASETDLGIIGTYYTDLPGASARLYQPADIMGSYQYVIGVQVAVTSSATIGTWVDTLITTTEDVLHANTDYALLGYMTDTQLAAIAIKGPDTSNLRCGGPGVLDLPETRDYFLDLAARTGRPHIPVINSANKGSTYVSVCGCTASISANITLLLAQVSI